MDYETRQTIFACLIVIIIVLLVAGIIWAISGLKKEVKNSISLNDSRLYASSQQAPLYRIEEMKAVLTAYTARAEETDLDPMTTASGHKAEGNIAAANCLKFGTTFEYRGITYQVEDRLNSRYDCDHIDLLMTDVKSALDFGRRTENIVIYY